MRFLVTAMFLLSIASSMLCAVDLIVDDSGYAQLGNERFRCAIGKMGLSADKKEGDGTTPIGSFPLRRVLYRMDKIPNTIITKLSLDVIKDYDGWCDDVDHPDYNKFVQLPFQGHHEMLWRNDDLYDIVVVVGYNDQPAVKGKGSAIFLHVATPTYSPTEGSVAFSKEDLLQILAQLDPSSRIIIKTKA